MTNLFINIGLRDCDGRTYAAPSVLAEVLVFLQDCIVPETRCISRVAQSETEPTLCVALTVHDTRWHRASIVTRSGLHFPKKDWAKWRDAAVIEIRSQIPAGWKPIDSPEDFYYTHQGTGYYPNNLHIAWLAWLAALDSTETRPNQ